MTAKKNKKIHKKTLGQFYRVIDANFNRAKEGLRVCEETTRFFLNNKSLTQRIARHRHMLTNLFKKSTLKKQQLYNNRDTKNDPGKQSILGPARATGHDVFLANAQRVKEALRVLEEFSKIFDPALSADIQKLRFKFYATEKKAVECHPTLFYT